MRNDLLCVSTAINVSRVKFLSSALAKPRAQELGDVREQAGTEGTEIKSRGDV